MNICLHAIAASGGGVVTSVGTRKNAGAFADDLIIITQSPSAMHGILNEQIAPFCRFTNLKVNMEKTQISAIDYKTGESLDTSTVRFNGAILINIEPSTPYTYLGVRLRLDLDSRDEREYILNKTRTATDCLRGTCYTTSQILMLLRSCVIPIFRYSAPLTIWSPKHLHTLDRIWADAYQSAYRLSRWYPLGPLMFDKDSRGIQTESAQILLAKELYSHWSQCTLHEDETNKLVTSAVKSAIVESGFPTLAEWFRPGSSNLFGPDSWNSPSPLIRLQHWAREVGTLTLSKVIDFRAHTAVPP